MQWPLSPRQLEFITHAKAKWNIAHGSVRSGKTVGSLFAFGHAMTKCPDSQIYIVGKTFDTAYRNVVRNFMESPELSIFRPFCNWSGRKLYFRDKVVTILGAKDEGAIGNFQGDTYSLVYCDEMTLYPQSIIEMIDTRLSREHSKGIATMNPSHPQHPIKKWIDEAEKGNKDYYALHFTLDDNPYVDEAYKNRIKNSLSGVFYKRNYLGLWCLAEGAIFDFFEREIYVWDEPEVAAEYWVAGIDYGTNNNFACTLVGVYTGRANQDGYKMWAEKEYVWDSKKSGMQKTNYEYVRDVISFLEPYGVSLIYLDPSALSFKIELQRQGFQVIAADNDVKAGIEKMTSEMKKGNLFVCSDCENLIREIETYVWDPNEAIKGKDKPKKVDDHSIDSLRYVVNTHSVPQYNPYISTQDTQNYMKDRFTFTRNSFFR